MTLTRRRSLHGSLAAALVLSALGGCAHGPQSAPADTVPPPPTVASAPEPVAEVASTAVVVTPETLLAQGVKEYQSAQYQQAELDLKSALQMGLAKPADVALANKHLAFIFCTSKREAMCLAAFKAARAADPKFALTKAEAGHPMWGPVYRRSLSKKK
ncbi:MAG: TssQ family T6SS-associated lipoprotein [Burkholderiales bacterium]|nr:TssQ family T6SS-associated lipoprotein [Burkholderiales bacterium]